VPAAIANSTLKNYIFCTLKVVSILLSHSSLCRDGWEAKALLGYYEAKERAKYRRDREPLMIPPRRIPPPLPTAYASTRRSPKRRRSVGTK